MPDFNFKPDSGETPTITFLPSETSPPIQLINSRAVASTGFIPCCPPTNGAFASWLRTLRREGRVLYAVTVTYCDNALTPFTVASAQRRANRFYSYLLSRLFHRRHYNAPEYRPLQPMMVLFLDQPGSKRKNSTPQRSYSNTAPYHHHGFIAALPSLAGTIDKVRQRLSDGCRDSSLLDGIQSVLLEPLDCHIGKWTRYASAFDRGEYLLLPKSRAEFAEPVRLKSTADSLVAANSTSIQ